MRILAIETSCDETACAIVEDGTKVLANVIFSQISIHQATGGVVPEIAAREHVVKILPVIEEALQKAECTWDNIDAIAVTKGPGLLSSLIVGTATASLLADIFNKPLIPVNHIEGHLYAPYLGRTEPIKFPSLTLTVSGGHNEIVLTRGHGDYEVIGETLDDAAGEAFDKVAKMLGLPYPGGPSISKAAVNSDAKAFSFPHALNKKGNFDFSFSGVKTAVLQTVQKEKAEKGELSQEFIENCSASFQEAVCETLCKKFLQVANVYEPVEMYVTGGVSANRRLREMMQQQATDEGFKTQINFPENLQYCTDNAAMIACAAYFKLQKNPQVTVNLVQPDLSFQIS